MQVTLQQQSVVLIQIFGSGDLVISQGTLENKMFKKSIFDAVAISTNRKNQSLYSWRLRHKVSPQKEEKESRNVASDVEKFIDSSPEYQQIKDKLPKSLLKKFKTPESMYLINKQTAKLITQAIKSYLDKTSPIIEVNPGLGILTKELLQCQDNCIYTFETLNHFTPNLQNLKKQYPDRITFKIADFFGMWKLAFKDKMDGGNRIQELLGDLATEGNDRTVKIVGSMPGLSFVKHLINNIVFYNTSNQLGRPDLFITMPAHQYEFLTDSEIQQSKHKSIPALFQLLFSCKVITTVPKVHFLPWMLLPTNKRVTMMDEHSLYLVNITQREKLPCPSEYLPLLWYFFKPHMISKTTRVIPMLEQWIPGCGVWLITGQDPPDTNKELSPGADDADLPHITIFTEFGDLNLKQKITVFKKFISWPEFEQCQFRITMENNLPKFVTALEEDGKDTSITHIDDMDHTDSETET